MQQIVEKIKTTIQKMDLYDDLYKSVSKEFLPYSGEMIQYPKILNSLVSAEYLYRQYIEKKEPKSSFDYSCISVMYYLSLEDFANKLVYSKYEIEVLSNIGLKSPYEKKWKENDYSDYVSSYDAFWDKKTKSFKKTCEIGTLGYLLKKIFDEKYLRDFLTNTYNGIDIKKLQNYGEKLIDVAQRRNNAAHGGNYLTQSDVLKDKENVYSVSMEEIKGLIFELLEILFQNEQRHQYNT